MRTSSKTFLISVSLSAMVSVLLLGSTAGALAWYNYVTRATTVYKGTSINRSEQLQAGIIDEYNYFKLSDLNRLNLVKEHIDDHDIVFAAPGSGLTSDAISHYLSKAGYAQNKLPPVTSRNRAANDELDLYKSLTSKYSLNTDPASTSDYVFVPFAFKVLDGNDAAVVNQQIWVTALEAVSSGGVDTHKGIRTYFENVTAGTHFLVNPSSEEGASDARKTKVAGSLDLDADGFYDYDLSTSREIIYGDYDHESAAYSASKYVASETDVPVDVNGAGSTTASTFVAKHRDGIYTIDMDALDPKYAYYETLATIRPIEGEGGVFSGGKPVAVTNSNGIGYTNLTVYLEGWDFAVIDRIINTSFNLGIQFEVDRQS